MLAQKRRIALCAVLFVVLTAFQVHAARVSLSWTKPTTNQDNTPLTDLAGYKVYYGFASRSYNVTIDVGLTTNAVLSDLEDGRTYYFAVTAYDTSRNQSLFTEVKYTTSVADTDGDGLTDADEINVYHTNPNVADTDDDDIDDGDEINVYHTNPNVADTDDDGIDDGVEINEDHTNPNVADTPPPSGPPAPPPQPLVLLAVNAGGSQFAANGITYQADTLFSGGSTYKTTAAIADTTDDALYQSERYGNFSYNVPVDNGNYVVTLKFAEIYFSAPGKRTFDVFIEGAKVVSNLDVFAKVGKNRAHDVTVSVGVTDRMLNITFRSLINNAKVNAIVIKIPPS